MSAPLPQIPQKQIIDELRQRSESAFAAHHSSAVWLSRVKLSMGLVTTILSSIVSVTAFSFLSSTDAQRFTALAIAFLSLIVSVLSALQLFLRLSEQAEKHLAAAARYKTIRLNLAVLDSKRTLSETKENYREINDEIQRIMQEMSFIDADAPLINKPSLMRARSALGDEKSSPRDRANAELNKLLHERQN